MRNSEPPRLSAWLLERLAPRHRRESLVGDLREQVHGGRSLWWYRRQVIGTILVGLAADVAAHKLLARPCAGCRLVGPLPHEPIRRAAHPRNAADALQAVGIGPLGRVRGFAPVVGLLRPPVRARDVPDLHGNWLDGCRPAPPPPPRHRNCVLGDSADTGNVPGAGDTPLAGNRVVARLGVGVVPLGAPVSDMAFVRGVSALRPHRRPLERANR